MTYGLGNDVLEIARFQKLYARHPTAVLKRLFTQDEVAYCLSGHQPIARLTGRFCAKEAISKALGCGFGARLSFLDLEILPDMYGCPQVTLSPKAREEFKNPTLLVSISHAKHVAMATAFLYYGPKEKDQKRAASQGVLGWFLEKTFCRHWRPKSP